MIKKRLPILYMLVFLLCSTSLCAGALWADEDASRAADSYLEHALEQEEAGQGPVSDLKLPSVFNVMIRFLFSLLIIVGLIGGAALFYNKFFGAQYYLGKDTSPIKVLAHRYLDPKKSLYLIEVGKTILVVGSSPEGLRLITEINDAESLQTISEVLQAKSESLKSRDFKNVLAGFAAPNKDKGTNDNTSDSKETHSGGMINLQSHIQKIKKLINEK